MHACSVIANLNSSISKYHFAQEDLQNCDTHYTLITLSAYIFLYANIILVDYQFTHTD